MPTINEKIALYEALKPFQNTSCDEALGVVLSVLYPVAVKKITENIERDVKDIGWNMDADDSEKIITDFLGFNLREALDLTKYQDEAFVAEFCSDDSENYSPLPSNHEVLQAERELTGAY